MEFELRKIFSLKSSSAYIIPRQDKNNGVTEENYSKTKHLVRENLPFEPAIMLA